jgi:hypothetical protein
MPPAPNLACPNCSRTLEYHVTIEMADLPVGKIDTGYCTSCARLFERVRETGTFYDSTLWPPVCRSCRQPVSFALAREEAGEHFVLFACRDHPSEQWTWTRRTERWARSD